MKLPKIGLKFKMNIGGRLALGFAAVSVVLAAAVGITPVQGGDTGSIPVGVASFFNGLAQIVFGNVQIMSTIWC
ncbi:MAG: hypothetical protein QF894_04930 [Alphaproteobacteria bacterium]|nr:hypothetical protein [Alphaproteobacteria bacterium]